MSSKIAWMIVWGAMLIVAAPAMAADDQAGHAASAGARWFDSPGAAFFGAAIIGGAAGIGRIGASAAESMARQPEAAGSINGVALILAAMIEGATLFAVVLCLLGVVWGRAL
jgi:F-type H+-transporting ATPase subunit c